VKTYQVAGTSGEAEKLCLGVGVGGKAQGKEHAQQGKTVCEYDMDSLPVTVVQASEDKEEGYSAGPRDPRECNELVYTESRKEGDSRRTFSGRTGGLG